MNSPEAGVREPREPPVGREEDGRVPLRGSQRRDNAVAREALAAQPVQEQVTDHMPHVVERVTEPCELPVDDPHGSGGGRTTGAEQDVVVPQVEMNHSPRLPCSMELLEVRLQRL